jgi:hypothetical protein
MNALNSNFLRKRKLGETVHKEPPKNFLAAATDFGDSEVPALYPNRKVDSPDFAAPKTAEQPMAAVPPVTNTLQPVQQQPVPQTALQQPAALPTLADPSLPKDSVSEYWGQPVVGKLPLDQFVRMAGMASNALAPDTPMGRLGAGAAQMAQEGYATRIKREYDAPNELLRRRLATAQVTGAEGAVKANEEMREFVSRMDQPVTIGDTTYANQSDAWKAAGKNPDREYLNKAADIISKYDPVKGAALRSQMYAADTSAELKQMVMDMKISQFNTVQDLRERTQNALNAAKERMIDISERSLTARERALEASKGTEFERKYQTYLNIFEQEKKEGKHPSGPGKTGQPMRPWDYERYLKGGVAGAIAEAKAPYSSATIADKRMEELLSRGGKKDKSTIPEGAKLRTANGGTVKLYQMPDGRLYDMSGNPVDAME